MWISPKREAADHTSRWRLAVAGIALTVLPVTVAAQPRATRSPAPARPGITDSARVVLGAQEAADDFLGTWRAAWRESSRVRGRRSMAYPTFARNEHGHCHVVPLGKDSVAVGMLPIAKIAGGQSSVFAKCPSGFLGPLVDAVDESEHLDGALLAALRPDMHAARNKLIAHLDTAQQALPGDLWLIGQRVRFRVEQGQLAEASAVAATCRMDRFWCAMLTGYALAQQRLVVRADSAFATAAAALPDSAQCRWIDISMLLDPPERAIFERLDCAERRVLTRRYWWLSDPLFGDPGNARRVEHFARRARVVLHSGLPHDGRHFWLTKDGGDAVADMLLRYGWPSHAFALDGGEQAGHNKYLSGLGGRAVAPYSTAEYTADRVRLGASLAALQNPFAATPADWALNPPADLRLDRSGWSATWWPVEHTRYFDRPLVALPMGQWAVMRRDDHLRVAAAIGLPALSEDAAEPHTVGLHLLTAMDSVDVGVWTSPAPDSTRRIAQSRHGMRMVRLQAPLESAPTVLGVEAAAPRGRGAMGRLRFGIVPPGTLIEMAPGEIALSDLVLFDVAANPAPANFDAVQTVMLGDLEVERTAPVGLFWETYGVTPRDSLRFTLNVVPADDPGLLRRIAGALRLIDASTEGLSIGWGENKEARAAADTASRATSIIPRHLKLNLRELPRGAYWVELVATGPAGRVASARRRFVVR